MSIPAVREHRLAIAQEHTSCLTGRPTSVCCRTRFRSTFDPRRTAQPPDDPPNVGRAAEARRERCIDPHDAPPLTPAAAAARRRPCMYPDART